MNIEPELVVLDHHAKTYQFRRFLWCVSAFVTFSSAAALSDDLFWLIVLIKAVGFIAVLQVFHYNDKIAVVAAQVVWRSHR